MKSWRWCWGTTNADTEYRFVVTSIAEHNSNKVGNGQVDFKEHERFLIFARRLLLFLVANSLWLVWSSDIVLMVEYTSTTASHKQEAILWHTNEYDQEHTSAIHAETDEFCDAPSGGERDANKSKRVADAFSKLTQQKALYESHSKVKIESTKPSVPLNQPSHWQITLATSTSSHYPTLSLLDY